MKALLAVALVALIHGGCATLLIKGPTKPILEGDMVKLECLYSDSDGNLTQVYIEHFSKYMQMWRRAMDRRSYCFSWLSSRGFVDTPFLYIYHASDYHDGSYRCVSDADNVTESNRTSEPLAIKVHYVRELHLSREGYSRYLSVPQELKVRLGDDVVVNCSARSSEELNYSWHKEGSDWILPLSTLTLSKVSAADEGQYTCSAVHPFLESLSKKRTLSITVLPEDAPWYESSNGRLILMTSAAAAAFVVFILTVSVFLCRRAKRIKTNKGPIDDRSQKKPIYKASVESLSSTSGDKQPLV